MATWIKVKEAMTFPAVINAYARAGGGMGNTTGNVTYPKNGFDVAVKRALAAAAAWVRRAPGTNNGVQDAQVDVTAIPGVPPLRDNGKRTIF